MYPQCTPADLERFWSHVSKTRKCWTWSGFDTDYPRFWLAGKLVKAHRLSWELANGPIPPGLWVLHLCDNKRCVRPDHLYVGTRADNLRDMRRKGRGFVPSINRPASMPRGERNGFAKLTSEQVRMMRQRYAAGGVTYAQLGREFGTDEANVGSIIQRKTWRHVGD
jgi:hypothetical protein